MAAYMGSSFTGGLPAVATAATMDHVQNRRGASSRIFPHTEPYAIPRNDTIECLTLVGPRQFQLGDQAPSVTAALKVMPAGCSQDPHQVRMGETLLIHQAAQQIRWTR